MRRRIPMRARGTATKAWREPPEMRTLGVFGVSRQEAAMDDDKGRFGFEPEDFEHVKQTREFMSILFHCYEVCEQEAEQGKAKAVNLLARFESDLKRASDRMQRKELRRRIVRLQTVWGV